MQNLEYSRTPHFKIVDYFSEHLFEAVKLSDLKAFFRSEDIDYQQFRAEFLDKEFAVISGENIFLDFQNRFIRSLKTARDLYLIKTLGPSTSNEIFFVFDNILTEIKDDLDSVVLIGSAARRMMKPSSDLDLFVITDRASRRDLFRYRKRSRIQVQLDTRSDFSRSFEDRDELTLWVLKYGLIIYDNDYIFDFYLPSELKVGEKTILEKRKMIKRLIDDISDSPNVSEERIRHKLRRLVFQMARHLLILNNELPLSRAELPDQLKQYAPELSKKIVEFEEHPSLKRQALLKYFYEVTAIYRNRLMHT